MIELKRCPFGKLRDIWLSLESDNPNLTAYQSYALSERVLKTYIPYRIINRENPFFLTACTEDGDVLAIIPLATSKDGIVSFGYSQSMPVYDIIWKKDADGKLMEQCLDKLIESYPNIIFNRIRKDTALYDYLSARYESVWCDNVAIDVKDTRDEWYNGLSKSNRQNIRTAYNRARTDNIPFEFRLAPGKDITSSEASKIMDIYVNRRKGFSDGLSKPKELMIRHCHYNTSAMRTLDSSIVATLWSNGTLAAFWAGYLSPAGESVTVPRLAFNPDLAHYSPGQILINETIGALHEKYPKVKVFDLSSGSEKYKFDMGGVGYDTYIFNTEKKLPQ